MDPVSIGSLILGIAGIGYAVYTNRSTTTKLRQIQELLAQGIPRDVPAPPDEPIDQRKRREAIWTLEQTFHLPASGVTEPNPSWQPPPSDASPFSLPSSPPQTFIWKAPNQ